jgi:hypothetical protein
MATTAMRRLRPRQGVVAVEEGEEEEEEGGTVVGSRALTSHIPSFCP